MPDFEKYAQQIFRISNPETFNLIALEAYHYQLSHNKIYRTFARQLMGKKKQPEDITQIPFLPVSFFRSHPVISGSFDPEKIFESSGTSGEQTSRHQIKDLTLYEQSFLSGFKRIFGNIEDYVILGLLPAYLERKNSSLIYMVQKLIECTGRRESGFFLYQYEEVQALLKKLKKSNQKTILFGVTYALLDLAEQYPLEFPELIIIETGGMKGKRKEMVREEIHKVLTRAFGVPYVYSEYGMTELLSQAYSQGSGLFQTPPWMKILIRDPNDPLTLLPSGRTGGINVIDLANIHSCAFIATQDLGKVHPDGQFEVLGRFDYSDMRGCNLMVE